MQTKDVFMIFGCRPACLVLKPLIVGAAIWICMLFTSGCSGLGSASQSGNKDIKSQALPYTGISEWSVSESTSRKTAFEDAISQISLFNGVEINSELTLSSQTGSIGNNPFDNNITSEQLSIFTKSFFEVAKADYYTEARKSGKTITYKSWCHIPFAASQQDAFLNKLIQGYQAEIQTSEGVLNLQGTDLDTYLDNLQRTTKHYVNLQARYQSKFSTPNKFTVFLQNKVDENVNRINRFYAELNCVFSEDSANSVTARFSCQGVPFLPHCLVKETGVSRLVESVSQSKQGEFVVVRCKPSRSGTSTVSFYPEYDRFHEYVNVKSCDYSLKLQLCNRFVGKKVGIAIYNTGTGLFVAAAAGSLGKVIADLEGSSVNLNPSPTAGNHDNQLLDNELMADAREHHCDFLMIGKAEITNQRFNQSQGVYIAFPALTLSLINLNTGSIIWQNSFPNTEFDDIRGLGKSVQQATENALSFEAVFGNNRFWEVMENL